MYILDDNRLFRYVFEGGKHPGLRHGSVVHVVQHVLVHVPVQLPVLLVFQQFQRLPFLAVEVEVAGLHLK